jgi:Zn-dependent peptidase ImmA (M78 family)
MADYPAKAEVLSSAREVRNLSQEQAADLLGIPVGDLRALEEGCRQPTLGQLRKMAKAYGFPLATLGHRNRLQVREAVTDFRTVDGAPAVTGLEVAIALDEARQLQDFAAELIEEDERLYRPPELPAAGRYDDPAALAARERHRLGYTSNVQLEARDAADAFNYLRMRLEDLGIFVYLVKVPVGDCRGFFLLGEGRQPPLITVNDAEPLDEAKMFTLVHEYCHVLLRAPGISGYEHRHPTERFCNQFAANFLMPIEVVQQVMMLPDAPVEWERPTISAAARRLKVSQQALVLRLEEMGRAPPGFYDRWVAQRQAMAPPRTGGFAPWERRVLRKFGTAYAGMVLDALRRGTITQLDAYRLLKVKPPHLEALRRELAGRRERVRAAGA